MVMHPAAAVHAHKAVMQILRVFRNILFSPNLFWKIAVKRRAVSQKGHHLIP